MTEENGGKKREKKEKTDENSGHYVVASSQPPERRLLERRTLAPIIKRQLIAWFLRTKVQIFPQPSLCVQIMILSITVLLYHEPEVPILP